MKLQKARKNQTCEDCLGEIPAGDMYWNDYDETSGTTTRVHTNCELYSNQHQITVAGDNKDEK